MLRILLGNRSSSLFIKIASKLALEECFAFFWATGALPFSLKKASTMRLIVLIGYLTVEV
jgi:hypothetical protein